MIVNSEIIRNVRKCSYEDIKHFNGRAPKSQSHIYEGKTPIHWFKIESCGRIVGCYGIIPIGKEARFRGWFVDSDYRNMGIGAELARSAMIEAKKMGFERFEVKTSQSGLMERLGIPATGATYKSFGGAQYRTLL